jgi:WD40 repeat protein
LAYLELKILSAATSNLPFPADQTPPPAAPTPTSGTPLWAVVVADLDEDGSPTDETARVEIPVWGMSCPAWSPDGTQFAYSAGVEGAGTLWVSTLDGRRRDLMPTSDARVRAIDWSPDGKTIAVADVDRIALVPGDGDPVTTISVAEPTSVAWSPAGTLLAYGAGPDVWVVRTDGTEVAAINGAWPDAGVAWSPDGQWLATLDGTRGLVRLRVSDNTAERLPLDGFNFDGIHGWSPDGKWMLLGYGGVDTPASLVAVPWDRAQRPVVLFAPTFAVRGIYVDWQGVSP